MAGRYELSEAEWNLIKDIVPSPRRMGNVVNLGHHPRQWIDIF